MSLREFSLAGKIINAALILRRRILLKAFLIKAAACESVGQALFCKTAIISDFGRSMPKSGKCFVYPPKQMRVFCENAVLKFGCFCDKITVTLF